MRRYDVRGQVWVETVIYTLIGLAVIGLVMAVALPKINEKKDEIIIEQSIEALGDIDGKIYGAIGGGVGNRRIVDLDIRKGTLIVDMDEDSISWVLDSRFKYSEPGVSVPLGRLNVTTVAAGPWEIELKVGYGVDLQFDGSNFGTKRLDVSPTPYKFVIENIGKNADGNILIDLSES
jgi:hypothetical protein